MEEIYIEGGKSTPKIETNFHNGIIKIEGKSYPENTYEFYEPFLNRLEKFLNNEIKDKLQVDIEITYFNSSSTRVFYEIFELLENKSDKYDIIINWICDSEDEISLDIGNEFKEDFDKLINLVEK